MTTLSYSPSTVFILDTNQEEASQFLLFLSRGFLYYSCLNTVVVETVWPWANDLDYLDSVSPSVKWGEHSAGVRAIDRTQVNTSGGCIPFPTLSDFQLGLISAGQNTANFAVIGEPWRDRGRQGEQASIPWARFLSGSLCNCCVSWSEMTKELFLTLSSPLIPLGLGKIET